MPESESAMPPAAGKNQRVLACMLCQQRKIKCDRNFPCAHCTRAGAQCVPASSMPRQRRRRFAERDLLDRLRHYENLLRRQKIPFEPLHPPRGDERDPTDKDDNVTNTRLDDSYDRAGDNSDSAFELKNVWHAMNDRSPDDPDDDSNDDDYPVGPTQDVIRESVIKRAWDHMVLSNDSLLFGLSKTGMQLAAFHPQPAQIMRLWQIFLDNVNPLIKVLHPPSMQIRVIEATINIADIEPAFEALMFSIYCIAIHSLDDQACRALFALPKKEILKIYQVGCQQALLNCDFLKTGSREVLTALHLYLIAIRTDCDARALSTFLGVAMRTAQRMNLQREGGNAPHGVYEAEMRRRLWWSLVMYDRRVGEMADFKTSLLDPTWNCRLPLNMNDSDFSPDMTAAPVAHERATDAIFAVMRSELGDFSRHSALHLDFINPLLKTIARKPQSGAGSDGDEVTVLERMIEDKYLQHCNPETPLHYMTIWMARGQIAKAHLMQHFARSIGKSPASQTDAKPGAAIPFCLKAIECDSRLLSSPLTKGYRWLIEMHFPFPAYAHLLQDLRRRPTQPHTLHTWHVLDTSYSARKMDEESVYANLFYKEFVRMVLRAWDACEAVFIQTGQQFDVPFMIADIRSKGMQITPSPQQDSEVAAGSVAGGVDLDPFAMTSQMDLWGNGMSFGSVDPQLAASMEVNQIDWGSMDLNTTNTRGW